VLMCSLLSLVAEAFSLNPLLVPVVSSSVTCSALPSSCCLGDQLCPEHVSMGTPQSEIRDNFPGCWTAWEIANQKVKNKRWRENEGKMA